MSEAKTYVLMVTAIKVVAPILAPATAQGEIDARVSFDVFPAAVSDDADALRERAMKMRRRFTAIDGWNVVEVPVVGGDGHAD